MTEVYPTSDWGYRRLGRAWYREGHHANAQQNWTYAIILNPKDTQSMNNLAVTHMATGELAEAQRWLERTLAIEPNDSTALSNLEILRTKRPGEPRGTEQ